MSGFNYSKWDNLVDSDDEQPKAAPQQVPQSAPPRPAPIDQDDRSEVEKLKARKRAERAARF